MSFKNDILFAGLFISSIHLNIPCCLFKWRAHSIIFLYEHHLGGIVWVLMVFFAYGDKGQLVSSKGGGGGVRLLNGMASGQSHAEINGGRHTVAQGLQRFH